MSTYLGFIARTYGDGVYWMPSTNVHILSTLPDEEVRWWSTADELEAQLRLEYSTENTKYSRVWRNGDLVIVSNRPIYWPSGCSTNGPWTDDETDELVGLAKAAGKEGVLIGVGYMPAREGLVRAGDKRIVWDPKRWLRERNRAEATLVAMGDVIATTNQLVEGFTRRANGGYDLSDPLFDVLVVLRQLGEPSRTLVSVAAYFMGIVLVLERLRGKRWVRSHPQMKKLLECWKKNHEKNWAKWSASGESGARLAAWLHGQCGLPVPQPALV